MRNLFLIVLISLLWSCEEEVIPPPYTPEYLVATLDTGSRVTINNGSETLVSIRSKTKQNFHGLNAVVISPIYHRDQYDTVKDNCFAPYVNKDFTCTAFTPSASGLYQIKTNAIVTRPNVQGELYTMLSRVESSSYFDIDTLSSSEIANKAAALEAGQRYAVRLLFIPK